MKPYDVLATTYREEVMPRQGSTFVQLSEDNRKQISRWKREKKSNAEIARLLGVHRSTVGREIKSNMEWSYSAKPKLKYSWELAQANHVANKKKCGAKCKVGRNLELVKYIEEQVIKKKWSPNVAIEHARINNLHEITFTSRTVYNWVKKKLVKITPFHLRYSLARKTYKQRQKENKKRIGGISIEQRPENINNRSEFGHWELDCILDSHHQAILVMQERTTKWFVMARLARHDSHSVFAQVGVWFGEYGVAINSITYDNGFENARLWELGIQCFYTRPYAPHEKGGVENLNGRIRWDIPKGGDFDKYSQSRLAEIATNINDTPRPILNFQTPSQQFRAILNQHICCN